MQHVKLSWLRRLNYGMVCATGLLFITYYIFERFNVSQATRAYWGITPAILVFGAIHALYVLLSDQFLLKRFPWLTTFVSYAIYAFFIAACNESAGNTNIVYRAAWGVLIIGGGMLGPYVPLTSIVFSWSLFIFTMVGIATPTKASPAFNIIVDSCLTIAALAGWLLFHKYYIHKDDAQSLELKRMLAQEQFKSNVILESITDGVVIISTKGAVQALNDGATSMLGWSEGDAKDQDYHTLIQTKAEGNVALATDDAITLSLATGKVQQKVSLLQTHHGHHTYVDIVASPIYEKSQTATATEKRQIVGIIAVLRDVDEQKRSEQQRSDFISTASHEMRTPVASIRGFIELSLNPKVANIDGKAREYLLKAEAATEHLGELFRDLLTVSETDEGTLSNNPQDVDIAGLLNEIINQQKPLADGKGLGVVTQLEQSLYVHADPTRLSEALANVFENAIKYTDAGTITVSATFKDQVIIVQIKDTGIGIGEEDMPHLFQKFYRIDSSATREVGGTGLGLYITKQVADMIGGRVSVQSTVGAGSTFTIELPRTIKKS